MTTYKLKNSTVTLLHYGNKKVFVRNDKGEELLLDKIVFDEMYENDGNLTPEQLREIIDKAISRDDTWRMWLKHPFP